MRLSLDSQQKFAFGLSIFVHCFVLIVGTILLPGNAMSFPLTNKVIALTIQSMTAQNGPAAKKAESRSLDLVESLALKSSKTDIPSKPIPSLTEQKQEKLEKRIKDIRAQLAKAVANRRALEKRAIEAEYGIISLKEMGQRWDQYLNEIRQQVVKAWYPRLVAVEGMLKKSEARLDFTLNERGKVLRYRIVSWKGSSKFREMALEAFQEALPFKRVPLKADQRNTKQKFTVSFYFYYQ